jgi:hypothetical protein
MQKQSVVDAVDFAASFWPILMIRISLLQWALTFLISLCCFHRFFPCRKWWTCPSISKADRWLMLVLTRLVDLLDASIDGFDRLDCLVVSVEDSSYQQVLVGYRFLPTGACWLSMILKNGRESAASSRLLLAGLILLYLQRLISLNLQRLLK